MKAIMISIRPQWLCQILSREKPDEIRRGTKLHKAITKLIKEQGVAPMLAYCTKGKAIYKSFGSPKRSVYTTEKMGVTFYDWEANGKVVASFNATSDEIKFCGLDRYATDKVGDCTLRQNSCLTIDEMHSYLKGNSGTDIHISELEVFHRPVDLRYFSVKSHTVKGIDKDGKEKTFTVLKPLTKAPQSWCYVEADDE